MRELSVAEQRYQAVLAVISDGLSISQVASKVGVSRQTLHSWLARRGRNRRLADRPRQRNAMGGAAAVDGASVTKGADRVGGWTPKSCVTTKLAAWSV